MRRLMSLLQKGVNFNLKLSVNSNYVLLVLFASPSVLQIRYNQKDLTGNYSEPSFNVLIFKIFNQ